MTPQRQRLCCRFEQSVWTLLEDLMSYFDKRPERRNEGPSPAGYDEFERDFEKWPALTSFIGRVCYSDGSPREPGSVLLFVDQGRLKVMVKDNEERMVGFTTFDGLAGLLEALDEKLSVGRFDWRKDRQGGRRR